MVRETRSFIIIQKANYVMEFIDWLDKHEDVELQSTQATKHMELLKYLEKKTIKYSKLFLTTINDE